MCLLFALFVAAANSVILDHEGKVTQVYRKKFVIHVERLNRDKANQHAVPGKLSVEQQVNVAGYNVCLV